MLDKDCCKEFKTIIMDCEMPFKNGWETTLEICNNGFKTPILGYTAYSGLNDI